MSLKIIVEFHNDISVFTINYVLLKIIVQVFWFKKSFLLYFQHNQRLKRIVWNVFVFVISNKCTYLLYGFSWFISACMWLTLQKYIYEITVEIWTLKWAHENLMRFEYKFEVNIIQCDVK